MARALTSDLSTLSMDDTETLANQPFAPKSPRDEVTAPAASNRSSNSEQEQKIETEMPHKNRFPGFDTALSRIYRYTPVHKNRFPGFDTALSRIYRYTPVPTLILNEDLCVVEVSDSHCIFSG
ncbi:unnamed protein product [Penicillium nalgiovense]|nr:unnamed protein product [Penicillium nalgiovense]